MSNGSPSRFAFAALAGALLASCEPAPSGKDAIDSGAEVTVPLPPALPEPEAEPPVAAVTAGTEAAIELPPAPAAPAAPATEPEPAAAELVAAPPPLAMPSLARYIRGAGFACDEVVSSTQLERAGDRVGIYKFDCASGEAYQGTMRRDHLYFREWRGIPAG